jgi:hypothetical protein
MASAKGKLAVGVAVALVAVLLVAFLVGCASLVIPYGWPRFYDDVSAVLSIGFVVAIVTIPFAAVSAIVVGVPIFKFMHKQGFNSFPHYLASGIVISLVLAAVMTLARQFAGFLDTDSDFQLALWIIGIGGPVAALIFRSVTGVGPSVDRI